MKLLLRFATALCKNNDDVFGADNPDPEGQGFCQAGFSVEFTKVTAPSLLHFVYVRHVLIRFYMIYCNIQHK